jgi:hypothetical protein
VAGFGLLGRKSWVFWVFLGVEGGFFSHSCHRAFIKVDILKN